MRRKRWLLLALVPLLIIAADFFYWQHVVSRVRADLQTWAAERRGAGWEVSMGPVASGGWPYAAIVSVSNLALRHAGPAVPGDIRWTSATTILSVRLYDPTDLAIGLNGPQHVQIGTGDDMIVTGEPISLQTDLLAHEQTPVSLRARGLRLEPASGRWHATVGLLTADAEFMAAPTASQAAITCTFSAEAIGLPATARSPLGSSISSLALHARVSGPLSLRDQKQPDMRAWAEAWRDAGGSLEVSDIAMGWGPLGLAGGATLALDDQLQPMGSGNAHIVGFVEALDKLAAAGAVTKSAATAAKAVLSLLAGSGNGDDPPTVDVPLTLQYRTLSMRQVPLVRLPELDWPSP